MIYQYDVKPAVNTDRMSCVHEGTGKKCKIPITLDVAMGLDPKNNLNILI